MRTFNAVTVDGDRSTNDTCLLFATGPSGAPRIGARRRPAAGRLPHHPVSVLMDLAQQLVRDGEEGDQAHRRRAGIARDRMCDDFDLAPLAVGGASV